MSSIFHYVRLPSQALALMLIASSPALAQFADFDPGLEFPGLSQATLGSMHAAAARLTHQDGAAVGTVEKWTSPDGTNGEVKLLRVFVSSRMPCRTVDYLIGPQDAADGPNPNDYVLTWCRLPAGMWKIVPVPPPT